jgi:hypothetical protein
VLVLVRVIVIVIVKIVYHLPLVTVANL